MTLPRRRFLHLAAGAAALAALSRIVAAQTYPDRPVRVVVPYAPGGPTDVITRLLAQKLSEQLGKQFYVENMGGGGGNIAMGRVARMAPDGYTLLMVNPSYVVNPTLYGKVPYDFDKDFDLVTLAVAHHLGDHGPSVGAGAYRQGPRRAHQGQSRQIQLRVAGNRNAGTSRRRNVPPVARPRSCACALQQRGPGSRLGGRRPYADLLRLAVAGRASRCMRASCGASR